MKILDQFIEFGKNNENNMFLGFDQKEMKI